MSPYRSDPYLPTVYIRQRHLPLGQHLRLGTCPRPTETRTPTPQSHIRVYIYAPVLHLVFYRARHTDSVAQTCAQGVYAVCFPSTSPPSTIKPRPSTAPAPTPSPATPPFKDLFWTRSQPPNDAKHVEYTPVHTPITCRPSRRLMRFCAGFRARRPAGVFHVPQTAANTRCTGETQSVHMRVFACFGVFRRCQRCAEACFGVHRGVQRVCLRSFRVCTRPKAYEVGV